MNKKLWTVCLGLCSLAALLLSLNPSAARAQSVKPKPPMYSYVANWQVPRASWGDMDKVVAPVNQVLQQALADGTIVGYGNDRNLVHQPDTETHDDWWSAMSLAGLIKTLDRIHTAGDSNSPILSAATNHWDEVYVSRFYNWKSGSFKKAYTHVGIYRLKPDQSEDALDALSQNWIAPTLEKLLANGTILEYEIDTMAIHTEAPGMFVIVYLTPTPEGLDTVLGAVVESVNDNPMTGQAFGGVTDSSAHRDALYETTGAYK
jgi:hypothetical protein